MDVAVVVRRRARATFLDAESIGLPESSTAMA